jgi:hypothetical protein
MSRTKPAKPDRNRDLRITLVGWAPDPNSNPIRTRKRKAKTAATAKIAPQINEKSTPKPRGPPKERSLAVRPKTTPKARKSKAPHSEDASKAVADDAPPEISDHPMTGTDDATGVTDAIAVSAAPMEADESDVEDTIVVSNAPVQGVSLPTDGFKKIHKYVNTTEMRKIISEQSRSTERSSTSQYVAFKNVTRDAISKIEASKSNIERHWRMTHYIFPDLVIVKALGELKEVVEDFSDMIVEKLDAMGVTDEDLYFGIAKSIGQRTSKEADLAYKPLPTRSGDLDWPTIVVEVGISESIERMRKSADWWLTESGGQVKTVLIIADWADSIEKWELAPGVEDSQQVPTCVQTIGIENSKDHENTVTGGPLVLDIENMFLRPPRPSESDIVFTDKDLVEWKSSYDRKILQESIIVEKR